MKIKLFDRVILFFGALLAGCSGIFLIVCGMRMLEGEAIPNPWLIISLVLGVLCLLLCLALMGVARKYAGSRHAFVTQQTDNGQLRIAVKAIENLVKKCIGMHEEIHANSLIIHHSRHDVTVELSISLADNISIPLAVASLQKQIKQYLVASSGVDVKAVKVSVESTQEEAPPAVAPDSPYLVAAQEGEEEQRDSQKMPVHRRLFGKEDQPVTLPEPPAPQATEAQPEKAEEAPAQEAPQAAEAAPEAAEETAAPAEEAPCQEATAADAEEKECPPDQEARQACPCCEAPAAEANEAAEGETASEPIEEITDEPRTEMPCEEEEALPAEDILPQDEKAPEQMKEEASHE